MIDQQFMDYMGSPFLLAHGMGIPVKDAVTKVHFPETGTLSMFGCVPVIGLPPGKEEVPEGAYQAPGRFQLHG